MILVIFIRIRSVFMASRGYLRRGVFKKFKPERSRPGADRTGGKGLVGELVIDRSAASSRARSLLVGSHTPRQRCSRCLWSQRSCMPSPISSDWGDGDWVVGVAEQGQQISSLRWLAVTGWHGNYSILQAQSSQNRQIFATKKAGFIVMEMVDIF